MAKWRQRRNDFGAKVGRDAQKGKVGVHHYCFLLGQRVGEGGRRTLGDAHNGGSRPGPTPPKVQVEATANPSPMAVGLIKAETRGEAAGRRGCSLEPSPQRRKFKWNPKWKGKRVASGE